MTTRRLLAPAAGAVFAANVGLACVGTTGGELVSFHAAAAGPQDATSGQPLRFSVQGGGRTWSVVLTRATLHIAAVYLDQSAPVSGSQGTSCILPGTYVAQVLPVPVDAGGQVTTGLDVDLLSPALQSFTGGGQGTTIPQALLGQVWLTTGDVNSPDTTPILHVAGTAQQGGVSIPFAGEVTIGTNHEETGTQSAGGDPICKEHIVPVPTAIAVGRTGGLLVRIDPRLFFVNVDFALLTPVAGTYEFSDDPQSPQYTQPSRNLYDNLRSYAPYTFSWSDRL
jgi:hypothetical protein